jgi:hypothetical protein
VGARAPSASTGIKELGEIVMTSNYLARVKAKKGEEETCR